MKLRNRLIIEELLKLRLKQQDLGLLMQIDKLHIEEKLDVLEMNLEHKAI
jgi:hypothetical protein